MAFENLGLSSTRTTDDLGRGSLWGLSPGGVARVPSLDISILQGQICINQIKLLILRKGEGRVGAAAVGGRNTRKGHREREVGYLGNSSVVGENSRAWLHRASVCSRGLHHT